MYSSDSEGKVKGPQKVCVIGKEDIKAKFRILGLRDLEQGLTNILKWWKQLKKKEIGWSGILMIYRRETEIKAYGRNGFEITTN